MLDNNYFAQTRKRKLIGFLIIASAIVGSLYLRSQGYRLDASRYNPAWHVYNVK